MTDAETIYKLRTKQRGSPLYDALWRKGRSLKPGEGWLSITDEELAACKAEIEVLKAEAVEDNKVIQEFWGTFHSLGKAFFGDGTKERRYLDNNMRAPRVDFMGEFRFLEEEVKRARQKKAEEEHAKQREEHQNSRLQKAILFLQGEGQVLGQDFTLDNAVQQAVELTVKKAIAKRIASGGPFDHSCCDSCDEWDGVSHRCSCGNRRMSWSIWPDPEPGDVDGCASMLYPEAY